MTGSTVPASPAAAENSEPASRNQEPAPPISPSLESSSNAGPSSPRTPKPERPTTQRTITTDRASIDAFISRQTKFRRSSLGRWILGDRGRDAVTKARNGQHVKGGYESPEDEDDGEFRVPSVIATAASKGGTVRLTEHWLEDHDIPIGNTASPRQHAREKSAKYAWDVLYENQFGIYIFGKSHFSSYLIPFGSPTAFTLAPFPNAPPSADISVSSIMGTSGPVPIRIVPMPTGPPETQTMSQRDWAKAQYLTGYNLKNKPLPSPEWEEVTPWMINMTAGTDESGWRYNYRFRANGWKSHAGVLGWGGWCRRRQWLKLIHYAPDHEGRSEPSPTMTKTPPWATKSDTEERKKQETVAEERLKKICRHQSPEDNLHALLKALGKVPLDRKRLELWDEWLSEGPDERAQLDAVLSLPNALEALRFAFTFSASFTDFLALLQKHDFDFKLESPPPSVTPPHELPSGPPAEPARPYTLTGP